MANPQLMPGGGRDPAVREMESDFDGPMGGMDDASGQMAGTGPKPPLGDYAVDETADNFYDEGMPPIDTTSMPVGQ